MPAALPRPGDLFAGKYSVERVLGEGAMGFVVAARHLDLDELRAIKVMLPAALGDVGGVERFLREARAAVRLRSRHVARVLDVGRLDDGVPYIVMEHLEGADLRAVLDAYGALPIAEAVRHVREACEAIAEAHAAGIVHRDLKPANLFLAVEPDGVTCVKVLDFGIAKLSRAAGQGRAMEMTRTTEIFGTPVFMSPEQMRATRDVDGRTDIWALGVILYRALTGRLPFEGTTITQVCAAVVADLPPAPSSLRAELPRALDAIVMRCLEKDPARRFASAGELSAALAPFAGERTAATPSARGSLVSTALPPPTAVRAPMSPELHTTGRAGLWEREGAEAKRGPRVAIFVVVAAAVVSILVLVAGGRSATRGERARPAAAPVAEAPAPAVDGSATAVSSSAPRANEESSAPAPATVASAEAAAASAPSTAPPSKQTARAATRSPTVSAPKATAKPGGEFEDRK